MSFNKTPRSMRQAEPLRVTLVPFLVRRRRVFPVELENSLFNRSNLICFDGVATFGRRLDRELTRIPNPELPVRETSAPPPLFLPPLLPPDTMSASAADRKDRERPASTLPPAGPTVADDKEDRRAARDSLGSPPITVAEDREDFRAARDGPAGPPSITVADRDRPDAPDNSPPPPPPLALLFPPSVIEAAPDTTLFSPPLYPTTGGAVSVPAPFNLYVRSAVFVTTTARRMR